MGGRSTAAIACLAAVAALLIAIRILAPSESPRLLVDASGWEAQGFVPGPHPSLSEIRRSVRSDPQVRFWMARPEPGVKTLRSAPFDPPRTIVLPYRLAYLGTTEIAPDVSVAIHCVASSERLRIALAPTNVMYSERRIQLPESFCAGPVRLIAESRDEHFIGLGTPFGVDDLDVWIGRLPNHVLRHASAALILFAFGFAGALCARSAGFDTHATLTAALTLGLLGHLSFFAFWLDPSLGRILAFGGLALSVAAILTIFRRKPRLVREIAEELREPLAVWLGVSLFFLLLLYVADTGAGAWQANSRFSPARWSSDNTLSLRIAEDLYRNLRSEGLLGSWHISDRPQLQTGLQLVARPFSGLFFLGSTPDHHLHYFHNTIGVVANSLWAFAVYALLGAAGLSMRARVATIVALALTPFAIFNTVYIWPKMLAGAFAVLALLPITPALRAPGPPHSAYAGLPLTAALAALSMLSHGGSISFFVGLGVWLLFTQGWPPARALAWSLAVGAAIMLPWLLWQQLVDPPGNALAKQAFAGTYGFGEEELGLIDTTLRSYSALDLSSWWKLKQDGLAVIFIGPWQAPAGLDWPALRRWHEFFFLVPAAPAYLGLALVALCRRRPARGLEPLAALLRWSRSLVSIGAIGIAVNWLVFWGPPMIHHQAYACVLLLLLGGILGAYPSLGRASYPVFGVALTYTFYVWIIDPLFDAHSLDVLGLSLLSLAFVVMGIIVYPVFRDGWKRSH